MKLSHLKRGKNNQNPFNTSVVCKSLFLIRKYFAFHIVRNQSSSRLSIVHFINNNERRCNSENILPASSAHLRSPPLTSAHLRSSPLISGLWAVLLLLDTKEKKI